MDSRERAILKTLLYSDFFDYPLKEEEPIRSREDFYFLTGRNGLVRIRKEREKISLQKMQKAKRIIGILSFIPTIKLIGISGALSMGNCDKDDDVDVFVITEKNFVWTTRFLMAILLLILGVYRNKNSKNYSDKICLNMLLDESKMSLEKNLYIAHEITQLIPVFGRDNVYKQFLQKNKWVEDFMVNALDDNRNYLEKKISVIDHALISLFKLFAFETIMRFLQQRYMKKDITNEIIGNDVLRLHPFNYGHSILQKYNKKLKEFKL